MKKSILIVLASILLSYPMNLLGVDSETPHEFKSGDIISAEMMNEIFEYINNANKMISASELIGTWSCSLNARSSSCAVDDTITWDWTVGTDSLYRYNSGTLVMIDDGDSTYSYTTSKPNMFSCRDSGYTGFGNWIVKNNILFIDFSTGGTKGDPTRPDATMMVYLKKVSNSKLLMEMLQRSTDKVFAECDRQNLAPNPPSNLTYALPADNTSSSITLTWTDSNTEVTGYKVIRKTVVTDNYTTVSTITDNTTRTFADTNVSTGSYWYRVRAYNSNGDGTPSKVVKSEFP